LIRLQVIFLVISAFVYFLAGLTGKYSIKKRLILATVTYVILFATVFAMVFISGDKLY